MAQLDIDINSTLSFFGEIDLIKYLLYCDGAASPNPGRGGIGCVCYKELPKIEIFKITQYVGNHVSNNYSEYMSLIIGLKAALSKGIEDIDVYMDSQLVIKQCKKEWQVREPTLMALNQEVEELKQQFKNITFYWIPRAENHIADTLSKEALSGY